MNHERFIQLDPGTGRSPVPVNYVRNLVELIAEVGVDTRRLLSQVGLARMRSITRNRPCVSSNSAGSGWAPVK